MRNEMSKDAIRLCIKRQELWDNPELNETLYLHHKGFTKLKNLDDFTQVRVLFLESNNFHKIENLHNLKQLEKLHLQKNRIEKIQNLQHFTKLKYLNLAQNVITKIHGLESLPCLETLIISENEISMPEFVTQITLISKLRELDLAMNKINCNPPECILQLLARCKSLRVLSLQGNPFVCNNKMPHYRSMVISHCRKLNQLDGRRICSEERRRCNAWGDVVLQGGTFDQANEADKQELLKIRLERSQQNAVRRSSIQSSISSSDRSKGSSVLENVKRTFGLTTDSRQTSSSEISASSWSRNINIELDYEAIDTRENSNKSRSDISIPSVGSSSTWKRVSGNSPRGID